MPVAGEWFRFYVRSNTRIHMLHLVDLAAYDFNGWCTCEAFQFKHGPRLERGYRDSKGKGVYECDHIRKASRYFARFMAKEMHKRLVPPKPKNGRVYVLDSEKTYSPTHTETGSGGGSLPQESQSVA